MAIVIELNLNINNINNCYRKKIKTFHAYESWFRLNELCVSLNFMSLFLLYVYETRFQKRRTTFIRELVCFILIPKTVNIDHFVEFSFIPYTSLYQINFDFLSILGVHH